MSHLRTSIYLSAATCLLCLTLSGATAQEAQKKTGGCTAGLAGCCIVGVPAGQVRNSGYTIPGRAWSRLLIVPILYDAYKAYQGETGEEYLGVQDLSVPAGDPKGGVASGLLSCCVGGVVALPGGQMYNSTGKVSSRSGLRSIPYVGQIAALYDGYKAYGGETLQEYAEIK